jgi:hypothetical protein
MRALVEACWSRDALPNFQRNLSAPQSELAKTIKRPSGFLAIGEDGNANREPRSLLTEFGRKDLEVVHRASSSLSRLWPRFFRLPPRSTGWPRAYHFRNGTGGGNEELANSAIHNAKVGWRCETVFPEERAPLGLFGTVS